MNENVQYLFIYLIVHSFMFAIKKHHKIIINIIYSFVDKMLNKSADHVLLMKSGGGFKRC